MENEGTRVLGAQGSEGRATHLILGIGEQLAQARGPRAAPVAPLAIPLAVARKTAQAHQPLSSAHRVRRDDDAVRAADNDALALRLRRVRAANVAPGAHHLVARESLLDGVPARRLRLAQPLALATGREGGRQRQLARLAARHQLQAPKGRLATALRSAHPRAVRAVQKKQSVQKKRSARRGPLLTSPVSFA